ncbi:hypothetical protein T492DRAFT_8008 [Pavlovales sp. CCMP2436]|nr:hypothetical protein T492DRAFT_8008 [Pavlovales sp. CCMP2436]
MAGPGKEKMEKKEKEDPVEAARLATAERSAHEAQLAAMHAELREQLGRNDVAEAQLRIEQLRLTGMRADHADITAHHERKLRERKVFLEETATKCSVQQEELLRGRTELRHAIDAEDLGAETRRSANRVLLEQNEQALAFMDEYEYLSARNAGAGASLSAQEAELVAVSADLDLKQRWSTILSASKLGADE